MPCSWPACFVRPALLLGCVAGAPGGDSTEVLAVHLALGGTPAPQMVTVQWHTNTDCGGAVPQVVWRLAGGTEERTATGVTQSWLISPNSTEWGHRAVIGPLQAGARYSYQPGFGSGGPAGAVHQFTMPSFLGGDMLPPALGADPRVIFFGDRCSRADAPAHLPSQLREPGSRSWC